MWGGGAEEHGEDVQFDELTQWEQKSEEPEGKWDRVGWAMGRKKIVDKSREAGESRLQQCGWSQVEGLWAGSTEG